ncbi:hypothetical protein MNBD_NITROSPINAE02-1502 [hydrothermal vent metagenome]|uniref:Uncharacterized protein n=1 Tax=hydrothermal vent metagenome TaxID=652676 RepID=A0A3B1CE80_9ZZZZ
MLGIIKMIFDLNGALSGYKTYIAAFAGALAVTADFLNGQVIPYIDGDVSMIEFIKNSVPQYVAMISAFWVAGALRAGIDSK